MQGDNFRDLPRPARDYRRPAARLARSAAARPTQLNDIGAPNTACLDAVNKRFGPVDPDRDGAYSTGGLLRAHKLSARQTDSVMAEPDIVVIGASAYGLESIRTIVRASPRDFGPAVFVVVHTGPGSSGMLPQLLVRAGQLPI